MSLFLASLLPTVALAAEAPCVEAASPGELRSAAEVASRAFGALDPQTFATSRAHLEAGIPCLAEAISPEVAARLHVVGALGAFLEDDEARTVAAFQAAQAADPELELGSWLPEAHPIRLDWRFAERLEAAPPSGVGVAGGAALLADGQATGALVLGRPAVLQRVGAERLEETLYWPGDTLPDWLELTEPRLSPDVRRHLWLGAGTAVSASATAALLAVAARAEDRFGEDDTPYGDLEGLRRTANTTSALGIGSGLLTAGLGLTLALTW